MQQMCIRDRIVSRLMGLFVCALAAQIIFTGVKNYLVP